MSPRPGSRTALALAAGCALAAAAVWLVAYGTDRGMAVDRAAFNGFRGLDRGPVEALAPAVMRLVDPGRFALLASAIILLALARRRWLTAAVAAGVLGGANVTTQLLKPALGAALDPGAAPAGFVAAWPSGHTTAAMSLALSLVLVAPARWRPAAGAAAGLGVVAIVSSIVTTGAHLPSDILGGFGVATAWAWLGVAVLLAAGRSPEPRPGLLPALAPPLLAGLAAAGVTLAAVMMRPDAAVAYAQEHTTFVVGAVAIGAAALSLLAGLAFALRR